MTVKRKYRQLFSPKRGGKPGPKGPSPELISAIIEMKRRNPSWACRRIAQQLSLGFDIEIDKDVVRRILLKHYRRETGAHGPPWLTFLGHSKDSLWSVDLFRFHRWKANLRILEITEVKTVPYLPISHPFVQRLIGAIRREYLDRALFWNSRDLRRKFRSFEEFNSRIADCMHRILSKVGFVCNRRWP